jgi:hypothetical protein
LIGFIGNGEDNDNDNDSGNDSGNNGRGYTGVHEVHFWIQGAKLF